jgi:hypothetical protein
MLDYWDFSDLDHKMKIIYGLYGDRLAVYVMGALLIIYALGSLWVVVSSLLRVVVRPVSGRCFCGVRAGWRAFLQC